MPARADEGQVRKWDVEYGVYHAGYSSMRLAGVVEVAEKDMDSKCILVSIAAQ